MTAPTPEAVLLVVGRLFVGEEDSEPPDWVCEQIADVLDQLAVMTNQEPKRVQDWLSLSMLQMFYVGVAAAENGWDYQCKVPA